MKNIVTVFLKVILMIAGVGLNAFLVSVWRDASSTAWRVTETLQAWDDKGLPATGVWKAQELLAHLWWLGPLRPSPPLDPLEACGLPEDVSWWSLVQKTFDTRRLLVCLEEKVAEAEAEHETFTLKITCVMVGLVMSLAFVASLYIVLHFTADKAKMESQDVIVDPVDVASDTKAVLRAGHTEAAVTVPAAQPLCTEEADARAQGQEVCKTRKKKKHRKKTCAKSEEEEDLSGEWKMVCKKQRKNRKTVSDNKEDVKCVKASVKPKKTKKRVTSRSKAVPGNTSGDQVRESWREDSVKVVMTVPPGRRQHVIGPRGNTIKKLRTEHHDVCVTVPLPQDTTSRHVTLEGPKSKVTAAAKDITGRLEAIDTQLREAAKRRHGNSVRVSVDVAPNMRRHVVGPGGEEVARLAQQHPGVRVSVPPSSDKTSTTVTIRGPPDEVTAVQGCITARLHAVKRRRQLLKARKGQLRRAKAKA